MREILGQNLVYFFIKVDPDCKISDIKFTNFTYEVWEVSDELFETMCDMNEEEFEKLAGDDAWWCSSEGCSLDNISKYEIREFTVKNRVMFGWANPFKDRYCDDCGVSSCDVFDEFTCHEERYTYKNLTKYIREEFGVSTKRNVCAIATGLAKHNNITMAELFARYEGMGDYDVEM